MPATRPQRLRVRIRTSLPWRKLLGQRTVKRTVQGVELYLPWSHALPDYARARSTYGQNLVELAAALADREPVGGGPLRMLDIGANVGDSTLQVLNRIDARVLCIEADPYWMRFLRLNAGSNERVTIEEALLVDHHVDNGLKPVRRKGTTSFVRASDGQAAAPRLSIRDLRNRHPDFDAPRLIKSDTDGYDPALMAAAAREWSASGPALFFEFDPGLARAVGDDDPYRLWRELAGCGYWRLAIWDNTGDLLGQLPIDRVAEHAARLEPRPTHLGYHFWDVAACRADDQAALAAFDQLIPYEFNPRGHRQGTGQPLEPVGAAGMPFGEPSG